MLAAGVDHGHFFPHPHIPSPLLASTFPRRDAAHVEDAISQCVEWTVPWWFIVYQQARKVRDEASGCRIKDGNHPVPVTTANIGAGDRTLVGAEEKITRLIFPDAEELAGQEEKARASSNSVIPERKADTWEMAAHSCLCCILSSFS